MTIGQRLPPITSSSIVSEGYQIQFSSKPFELNAVISNSSSSVRVALASEQLVSMGVQLLLGRASATP